MNEPGRTWVQVSAGSGPTEVRAFVARLAARLEALCGERALVVEEAVIEGDPEAPRSVELLVVGEVAAVLGPEQGTHALVERSAARGKADRKRWFAGVSLHPYQAPGSATVIAPSDLEVQAIRASGPGGQNVNKTSTAVRVLHRPSGLSVRVAEERSQRTNLVRAIARLAQRLAAVERDRLAAGATSRRQALRAFERGAPVRTYRSGPRGQLDLCS